MSKPADPNRIEGRAAARRILRLLDRCPSCGLRRYKHGRNGRQSLPFGAGYFHGPYPPFKGLSDA